MRNVLTIFALLGLIILSSCKKDDNITADQPPAVSFISDDMGYQTDNVISAAKGVTMSIKAEFTDPVGIKSFRLTYPDWDLDNIINLTEYYPDEVLTSYTMEFYFFIPDDADDSKSHEMALTVTNLGGMSTELPVIVNLNGDYAAPVVSNISPGNNATVPPDNVTITFDVTDDISLKYVVVEIPAIEVYDSITEFEDPKSYSYYKQLPEPYNDSYVYYIRVADHFNNASLTNVTFNMGIPQIVHMFLVDKSTQAELDKGFIGTTILMTPTENPYEHSVIYYCAEAGTEIRFMENPRSFADAYYLYGVEGDQLVESGIGSPQVLSQTGYYTFTINTEELAFSQSGPVAPENLPDAIEVPSPPWLYGRGVDDNHGGWDTYSDYMTVDPNNEYFFQISTSLGDAENDGYCEGCIGFELNGSTAWDHEYIWDDICWFGIQWYQDGIIDEIDENGGKPEGWAGLAGELETWSDEEENYWNTWADLNGNYKVTLDMYARRVRVFRID